MDLNEVVSSISTVGFPIVMCLIMFFQLEKQNERHKEEMDKISEAINNNTIALTKLAERIGGEHE